VKKKCNLILGAGGAKAIGQLGTIKALLEDDWEIANVCGVSAGSIIASLLSYNYDFDALVEYALNQNFYEYRSFNKVGFLKNGIYNLDKLGKDISLKVKNLDRVRNLHIVTCSILTGDPVIFKNPDKEDLSKIVQASCAIPVLFKPIKHGSDYLVDGAVWQATPYLYFKDNHKSRFPTFAVSCTPEPSTKDFTFLNSPAKVISRSFLCVQKLYEKSVLSQIKESDKIHIINLNSEGIDSWKLNPTKKERQKSLENYYLKTRTLLKGLK
jgi:predicted acylesterase/phospholipase RssA